MTTEFRYHNESREWKGNGGRCMEEIVDHTRIKYVYYKKGKVSVHVKAAINRSE